MNYIDVEELRAQLSSYQAEYRQISALPAPDCNPQMADDLGLSLSAMVSHFQTGYRWNRYPQEVKEDMFSHCMKKCIRAAQIVNLDRPNKTIFSYFARTMHLACLDVVGAYYRNKETLRNYGYRICLKRGNAEMAKRFFTAYEPVKDIKSNDVFSHNRKGRQ